MELGDIYKDLELSEKDTADVYINGLKGDDVLVSKANEVKIASDSGNKDKVGTGSTVEVFYDEDHNDVTIVRDRQLCGHRVQDRGGQRATRTAMWLSPTRATPPSPTTTTSMRPRRPSRTTLW